METYQAASILHDPVVGLEVDPRHGPQAGSVALVIVAVIVAAVVALGADVVGPGHAPGWGGPVAEAVFGLARRAPRSCLAAHVDSLPEVVHFPSRRVVGRSSRCPTARGPARRSRSHTAAAHTAVDHNSVGHSVCRNWRVVVAGVVGDGRVVLAVPGASALRAVLAGPVASAIARNTAAGATADSCRTAAAADMPCWRRRRRMGPETTRSVI